MPDFEFPLVYRTFWQRPVTKVAGRVEGSNAHYELEEVMGSGGNGVVVRAVDSNSGGEVAVKFLLRRTAEDNRRFQREIDFLRANDHPAIVSLIDHGVTRGRTFSGELVGGRPGRFVDVPFFVMPLADENLLQFLRRKEWRLEPYEYLGNLTSLADGLAQAHFAGYHRDLKPENILVFGEAWRIADFGLCFVEGAVDGGDPTMPGVPLGPRYWMSPEAIESLLKNERLENRCSDVFQMGAIFWVVINGHHPTGVVSRADWQGPENLFDPVWQALQWKADRRFPDGSSFRDAINNAIAKA
jgi:serine/threonine protein kinase